MGFFLACVINRSDLLQQAIVEEQAKLRPIGEADGWGIGFYQADEVLHKKRPQRISELDWGAAAEGIRSHCLIAHARHATSGAMNAENTHPFRMRQWLFAHAGSIDRYDAIRPRLLESMPDFVRRNIRGVTDSEHLFHVMLSFLHDGGQLDAKAGNSQSVLSAMRSTVVLVDRLAAEVGAKKAVLNMAITNGRELFALRRGAPLMIAERNSLPSVAGQHAGRVRYVMIVTGDASETTDYEPLKEGSIVEVDRELRVSTHPLD